MLLFSCLLLLLLSLVAYKTPWLVLVILVSMALVNGAGVSLAWNRWRATAARAAILALVAVCWLGLAREAYWTTRVRPADERNPYAYVHTSWDLPVLAGRIHRVSGNESRPVIKIMAEEYWPLPWYLRNLDQVGYWHTLPADPYAPVMVVGAELAGGLEPGRLMDYQVEIRGLRPGRLLLVYVRQDLWDDWTGYSP